MTTVVNNPPPSSDGGSGAGLIIGIVIAIVVVALLLIFGLPALRGTPQTNNGPAAPPVPQEQGLDVNVPDKIDVNVNTSQPE